MEKPNGKLLNWLNVQTKLVANVRIANRQNKHGASENGSRVNKFYAVSYLSLLEN
jgi:hypothetical protein